MTIIVTGAAGFIGSHTVDRLLKEGHSVVGLDNFRTGRSENLAAAFQSSNFQFEKIDITQPGRLDTVVNKYTPHSIIHLAALVSVQESIADPDLNKLLNVDATKLVAETAAAHRVPRIVFASSAAVYGDCSDLPLRETSEKRPLSPYGSAKLQSENLLFDCACKHDLTVLCLRYFNVYGHRQDPASPYSGVISIFRSRFSSGQQVTIYGDGEQTRDFIHVSDVAQANVLAATRSELTSGVFNICTGSPISLNMLVEAFRELHPGTPMSKHAAERMGDIRHSCGDAESARVRLGFSAKVLIRDGLREFGEEPVNLIRD